MACRVCAEPSSAPLPLADRVINRLGSGAVLAGRIEVAGHCGSASPPAAQLRVLLLERDVGALAISEAFEIDRLAGGKACTIGHAEFLSFRLLWAGCGLGDARRVVAGRSPLSGSCGAILLGGALQAGQHAL